MTRDQTLDGGDEPLHVFDLPQVYQRPDASVLRAALSLLILQRNGFETNQSRVVEDGVVKYLTTVVASPLAWLVNEDDREELWSLASSCLAQRSGRSGMSDMTRSFLVPIASGVLEFNLHEPAITQDNLGFKTWSSALALARGLHRFDTFRGHHLISKTASPSILELGSGTGLVGLAAAAIWGTSVLLTDLPQTLENLDKNIALNSAMLEDHSGQASCAALDWTRPHEPILLANASTIDHKFMVILAADTIYEPEHPSLIHTTVMARLQMDENARAFIAYPVREAFAAQVEELRSLLNADGLTLHDSWQEVSRDDWDEDVVNVCDVWRWDSLLAS